MTELSHTYRNQGPITLIPAPPGGVRHGGGGDDDSSWNIVRKLWRRKWVILGVTAAFVAAGTFALSLMTPRYSAEARVLVGVQAPHVTEIESVLKGLQPNNETVASEAYLIASREIARRVANRLALDKSPEFNPRLEPKETGWVQFLDPTNAIAAVEDAAEGIFGAKSAEAEAETETTAETSQAPELSPEERKWDAIVSRLLGRIEVAPMGRSYVLAISAESEEPVAAARIANAFGQTYVEQQIARKQQATQSANEQLEQWIADLRKQVEESERAVEEYRREHGLYETKSDTVIAQQLSELNRELVAAENAKARAEANLSQAEAALDSPGGVDSLPAVLQSGLVQNLRGQLARLQAQAAELGSTYTDEHPRMRDIRSQVAEVRGEINAEVDRIVSGLRHEAETARSRHDRVATQMADLEAQMGASNEQSVELRQLTREAEANRKLLENLMQRSKETVGQPASLTPDAEIISHASVPFGPSFPPTNLGIVASLLVGLGVGVLIALLLEKLDRSFRTSEDVEEYTGLPTLSLVPTERTRRLASHVVRKPFSPFTSSMRMLNARLAQSAGSTSGELPRMVMFTSAVPREGKSSISAAFAQVASLAGRRVAILDLDWERPALHKLYGQKGRAGLVDLLFEDVTPEEAVHVDPRTGVHAFFAGNIQRIDRNAAWHERLPALFRTLANHYDIVVLDTPPVLSSPEVLYLAPFVEQILYVVKWGTTPRPVANAGLKDLFHVGGRVGGVVLSQIDTRRYARYGETNAGYLYGRQVAGGTS